MQAGGAFLQPTLALLEQKKLLKPPGHAGPHHDHLQRRHPGGAGRDPRREDRRHRLPARRPVRQVRALYYAKAALEGKTFKPGPTDHDSHHHQDPERSGGPAPGAAGHQGRTSTTPSCGPTSWRRRASHGSGRPGTARRAEAEGIVKRFGPTVALDGARLTVAPGEAHALVGRNGAGKSTLVVRPHRHCTAPDAGTVTFGGEPAPGFGDTAAWQLQGRLRLPEVDGRARSDRRREPLPQPLPEAPAAASSAGARCARRAAELLAEYGVSVDPTARAKDLAVEQRQFVEIARALSFGARLIILDEPTAQLDARGIDRLFAKLRELQQPGRRVPLHLPPPAGGVRTLHTVTVYRDARHVLTAPVADLAKDDLVAAMTGEATSGDRRRRHAPVDREVRPGRRTGAAHRGAHPGGRVRRRSTWRCGPARWSASPGATASGNTALGETLVGLRKAERRPDHRTRQGRPARQRAARPRRGHRLRPRGPPLQGLVLDRSVAENATLTVTDQLGPCGTVLPSRTRAFARRMIASLDIKTPGPQQPVSGLSGGNQQKVVVARALAREPRVLVAIRPTAGWTSSPRTPSSASSGRVADGGSAAVIVSDELDDLRVCDRVLAMFHGRVVAEFGSGWSDRELVAAMEGSGRDGRGTDRTTGVPRPHGRTTDRSDRTAAERCGRRQAGCGLDRRWRDFSLVPVILVLCVIGFIVSPAFLTADNLIGVVQQSTELSLLVLGQALILICGRMDLSLESTIGVAPVIALWLVLPGGAAPLRRTGTPARLDGRPALPAGRRRDRRGQRLPDPQAARQRLHRHPRHAHHAARTPGRHLRGPVDRRRARVLPLPRQGRLARRPGRRVDLPRALRRSAARRWPTCATGARCTRSAATRRRPAPPASGSTASPGSCWPSAALLAAFAGILYTGHYGSVSATQGNGWIFQVFAAAVIGGISLKGGRGTLFGALTGVLTLQLVVNVMTLGGVPPLWNQFLNGAIIIVALIISRFASGEKQD